ncbi:MAG: UvrD-helicase domain-containing protein [Acidiferrobacterales bacterium]
MAAEDIRQSTAPDVNVVVRASAGTGKTWLLVARIIRLLLAGMPPATILAITFTRKAAAEIDARVSAELLALASADDNAVAEHLRTFGLGPVIEQTTLTKARQLFEIVVGSDPALRATTFHAFCSDLLHRFPLEAEVPAGFELLESTSEIEGTAWEALGREAGHDPDSDLGRDFDFLLRESNAASVREALADFLLHRSDWWAYTEDRTDPAAYASQRLLDRLGIRPDDDPVGAFISSPGLDRLLGRYADLIERHDNTTNRMRASQLRAAGLCLASAPQNVFALLLAEFTTSKGGIKTLKPTQTLQTRLGAGPFEELIALDTRLTQLIAATREATLRQRTYRLSCAWYRCGQRLLDHFQHLKEEQHALDFADLEWKAYCLLNHGRHAEWVQYKLDQRIDHLLVDEFQDTNPTQWRLLLPLLQEIAAGSDRARSVFLVGDEKQSIYRFRRADARLFGAAHGWLESHMPTLVFAQHLSRRSSPAIIRFVNLVFSADAAGDHEALLPDYDIHDTHLRELWGSVEILPLITRPQDKDSGNRAVMRDPLEQARIVTLDERHQQEGEVIAARIAELVGQPISTAGQTRRLDYGDIIILLRDRNHAPAYERALRRAGIPYVGAGRGALLDTLEIRDMLQLVRFLIAPQDSLALASILRSPVFSCTEEDLVQLAQGALAATPHISWFDCLQNAAAERRVDPRLARASRLLSGWRDSVDRVPVHDLLDRIYDEGNVIARYAAAAPSHLKSRVEANLSRFLELALEVDSGRFPSLARFHARLAAVRGKPGEAPQEPPSADTARVRFMTIHAVKGLEAPVVFLADAARDPRSERGLRALIHWPAESPRPEGFQIAGLKADQDTLTREAVQVEATASAREDANLLYVALTRARQVLVITGCDAGHGGGGWYSLIENRLRAAAPEPGLEIETGTAADGGSCFRARLSAGAPSPLPTAGLDASRAAEPVIDAALTRPLPVAATLRLITPSRLKEATEPRRAGYDEEDDSAGKRRGIVLHRMLQALTDPSPSTAATANNRDQIRDRLALEFMGELGTGVFARYWQEAGDVVDASDLRPWFDPALYDHARNEVGILYRTGDQDIYGIIDRLVIAGDTAIVIDYKTHAGVSTENAAQIASGFRQQLGFYATGVARLWPGKQVRAFILFTASRNVVEIPLDSGR